MSLKHEFPFFENNPELIYLDSAATTQKPHMVIDAVTNFYQSQNVNVHRSSFAAAKSLTLDYEHARNKIARLINAPSGKHISWTKGTTDSINTVALGWAQHHLNEGDRIVLLATEHHANLVPWQQIAKMRSCIIEFVELNDSEQISISNIQLALEKKPKLVAIQHVSNALGNIHPIEQICRAARQIDATILIDGAQAIAHEAVDVQQLDCDFYAFSAHKMFGPTGIGALYASDRVKDAMQPVQFGGEMITRVAREGSEFQTFPALLETGTPNISGVIGFSAAVDFISSEQYKAAHSHLKSLHQYLLKELSELPNIKIYGDQLNNVGIISFTIDDESVADIGMLLDQQNIAVRCGHHCAMPLMTSLGIEGTVRVSLSVYNDKEDIQQLLTALQVAFDMLDIN